MARPLLPAAICLVALTAANLCQHVLHPPVSWCEEAAAARFRTANWRALFKPWEVDPISGRSWTPAHEAALQDFSGKWVYISCITILLHWSYFAASFITQLIARPNRLTTMVYSCCAFIHGVSILVMVLYCVMWWVATYVLPEWRAQWDFFEERGVVWYPQMMATVHLPSLLCPILDILGKDPKLLREHTPSARRLVLGTTAYHLTYEAWLYLNLVMCDGAIPYPWYYDIGFSAYPMTGFVMYGLAVNALLVMVVVGFRRFILWRSREVRPRKKRA